MEISTDLVEKCLQSHDRAALGRLVAAIHSDVYHFLLSLLRDATDAEDATQDVFREVLRSLHTLKNPAAFPAWIHRIALHVAAAAQRARVGRRRLVEEASRRVATLEEGPMRAAARTEVAAGVRDAVAALDEELRVTVLLRYEQGLSYGEIADAMEVPEGTVGKRLHTAHGRLREALAGVGVAILLAALERELEAAPRSSPPPGLLAKLTRLVDEAAPPARAAGRRRWPAVAVAVAVLVGFAWLFFHLRGYGPGSGNAVAAGDPHGGRTALAGARSERDPGASPTEARGASGADPGTATPPDGLAVFQGRVLDLATGEPVRAARVILQYPSPSGAEAVTTTDADGAFRFSLPPGRYGTRVEAFGYVGVDAQIQYDKRVWAREGRDFNALPEEVEAWWAYGRGFVDLVAGRPTSRDIRLSHDEELTGAVLDERGMPVAGARVDFAGSGFDAIEWGWAYRLPGWDAGKNRWGKEGTVTLTDGNGEFRARGILPGHLLAFEASKSGFVAAQGTSTRGEYGSRVKIVLREAIRLTGSVLDAEGNPVSGAVLFAGSGEALQAALERTGPAGEFDLRDLDPATTTWLLVWAPGHGFAGEPVGGAAEGLVIRLPAATTVLRGCVTDAAGRPLKGARIQLAQQVVGIGEKRFGVGFWVATQPGLWSVDPPDGEGIVGASMPDGAEDREADESTPSAWSDADGQFQLTGLCLPPGTRFWLYVSHPSFQGRYVAREGAEAFTVVLDQPAGDEGD